MKRLLTLLTLSISCLAWAQSLDPMIDYRSSDQVIRNADGTTKRSSRIVTAFKRIYACPSTSLKTGACPGWAVDHVIPLACGGVDAVYNMQWLPNEIKSQRGEFSKDHFERRVYGGKAISFGCP